jgi:hypothetical protein
MKFGARYAAPATLDLWLGWWAFRLGVYLRGPCKEVGLIVESDLRRNAAGQVGRVFGIRIGRSSAPDVRKGYGSPWFVEATGYRRSGRYWGRRWPAALNGYRPPAFSNPGRKSGGNSQ